jgi:multiple sugar transport system permease protein
VVIAIGVFTELVRGDIYFWGSLMAACLTGTIPIIVLYAFFMDYYVSGLTAGAIK